MNSLVTGALFLLAILVLAVGIILFQPEIDVAGVVGLILAYYFQRQEDTDE
jgi:hypothetical protein